MKISLFSSLLCLTNLALAVPFAAPVSEEFDLSATIEDTLEERFLPEELELIHGTLVEKRDFEDTAEKVLKLVNDSGVIWAILDQVAYYPNRIEKIANLSSNLVGSIDIKNLGKSVQNMHLDLNISAIYSTVMESGLVTSILDGVLLDKQYRPHVVQLVNRVVGSSKNIFLWLVQDVFHKNKNSNNKRDDDERSGLETFVGNIISSALSSSLVGGVSKDVVYALNNTGVAVYVVQRFLADEGYQNMTAQLVLDIANSGKLKSGGKSINATGLVNTALSNPALISKLVGSLLTGKVSFSGMGKYTDAIKEIVGAVEKNGTFAELNKYVFSESHTLSTPVIPTDTTIVVPRTKAFTLTGLSGHATSSPSAKKTSSVASRTRDASAGSLSLSSVGSSVRSAVRSAATSASRSASKSASASGDLNKSKSQAEVDLILSLLLASTQAVSSSKSSLSVLLKVLLKGSLVVSLVSRDFDDIYNSLTAGDAATTDDDNATDVNTDFGPEETSAPSSAGSGDILSLINALSGSDSDNGNRDRVVKFEAGSSSASSTLAASSKSDSGALPTTASQFLVYMQVFLFGGLLML